MSDFDWGYIREKFSSALVHLARPAHVPEENIWVTIAGMPALSDNPVINRDREVAEPPRIRSPLCGWSPRKEDKWFCECDNEWNTFDTGGVCPACLHQWNETQCLSCSRWSPHSDWYAK